LTLLLPGSRGIITSPGYSLHSRSGGKAKLPRNCKGLLFPMELAGLFSCTRNFDRQQTEDSGTLINPFMQDDN